MSTNVPAEATSTVDTAFTAAAQARYADLRVQGPICRARIFNGIRCWMAVDYESAKPTLTHPALLGEAERNTLDIARQATQHLTFGHRIHHCLGAPLARIEAKIGIGALLRRSPTCGRPHRLPTSKGSLSA